MALLKIIKLSTKTWKHNSDIDGDFILTKFYAKQEDNDFLLVESYGAKRRKYKINEIEVYDIGGSAETFADFDALFLRLEVLKYPAFYVDGEVLTDFLSNDISTYSPATTPLNPIDKAIVFQDGEPKDVAVGEFLGDLQSVTDNGNSTTNTIITPIVKLPEGSFFVQINPVDLTANRKLEVPNKDGIIATLDDIPSNPITGTGTANRIAKFTASGVVGDSQIFDNGSQVGIGAASTSARLDVRAQGALLTDIAFRVRNSTDTADIIQVRGNGDVFIGIEAGKQTTAGGNTIIGNTAMKVNTSGYNNTSIGFSSLFQNTTGFANVAIGLQSLYSNTTGSNNTAFGLQSLFNLSSGNGNFAMGNSSGQLIASGAAMTSSTNSLFIGRATRANANGETNQIVIGDSAVGLGSNSITLGAITITKTKLQGQVIMGYFAVLPTGIEGAICFNTTDKKHYGFDGANWNALY